MKKAIFAAALLAFSVPAMAQKVEGCSIKAWKTTTTSELYKQAKLTPDEAKKVALDMTSAADKKVTEAKLETEDGCMVYQVDILAAGKKTEFMIDAGNGKILRQRNATKVSTTGTKIKEAVVPTKQ
jgi:uncharacterized membrane protein YkoI